MHNSLCFQGRCAKAEPKLPINSDEKASTPQQQLHFTCTERKTRKQYVHMIYVGGFSDVPFQNHRKFFLLKTTLYGI